MAKKKHFSLIEDLHIDNIAPIDAIMGFKSSHEKEFEKIGRAGRMISYLMPTPAFHKPKVRFELSYDPAKTEFKVKVGVQFNF
jgi:hypothetical protein